MKLSDQINRRQLFVAFGSSMQSGGLSSVDLAATRDAERVILTASDGSAAPVEGADPTAAGVMTAADKVKLDSLPPASFREFAARSEIASATIGAAITHLRTAGHAAAGDGGGALYKRAGAEPSHALKVQSADGAWWELVPERGEISFIACGGIEGDDTANGASNVTAFNNFIGYAQTLTTGESAGQYVGGVTLVFPQGHYHFNSHLNVKATVHIKGPGGGMDVGLAQGVALLEFPANTHGIIVHRHNTIDDTTLVTPTFFGDGSIIEGLALKGGGSGTTGHGIWLRARALIRNCYVYNWAQNGINIVATSGAGGSAEGNANAWRIEYVRSSGNGANGIFADGGDVNAGTCISADVRSNGRWGIWDSGFLGNTYIGCHSSGNGQSGSGFNGGTVSSVASYGGLGYVANADATEADYVATQPGTNVSVWVETSGLSGAIAWTGGQPAGTYVAGGSYRTDNANARHAFIGCYHEPGQGVPQVEEPTVFYGGHGFTPVRTATAGNAVGIVGKDVYGQPEFQHSHRWINNGVTRNNLRTKFNYAANTLLSVTGDGLGQTALARWDETNGLWHIGAQGSDSAGAPVSITTELLGQNFGRASTADVGKGKVVFRRGFYIGRESASTNDCRFWSIGTAAPTTGSRARGEIVWNKDPSSGGPLGWVCVTAGTPGTWAEIRGVGTQQPGIADPTGGTTVDAEARTAINSILAVLEHFGLVAAA